MSSGHRTSVGPKYPNEKPVSPLVIPTSSDFPTTGSHGCQRSNEEGLGLVKRYLGDGGMPTVMDV